LGIPLKANCADVSCCIARLNDTYEHVGTAGTGKEL